MIGKAKWFNPRKYTGWGLTPNCWQGWMYVFVFILLVSLINYLPIPLNIKNIITGTVVSLFLLDTFHLMSQVKKDERDRLHEAISDRNALWFLILFLIAYTFINNILNPIFIIGILGATIIKAGTQFYLRDK